MTSGAGGPTSASDRTTAIRTRAGAALRELGHAFIGRHATIDQLEALADTLETITADLWPMAVRDRAEMARPNGAEPEEYPQGRIDHDFEDRPISGPASPWGLDLELHRHGDEIEALVTLRDSHEGAPGRSHGGVVAALFDDVFGFVLGVIRQPAFTGELCIRYVGATPLHTPLACRVRMDERHGRKIMMSGELTDTTTGRVVTTARATFIAVDVEMFATAERPPPPDEDDGSARS